MDAGKAIAFITDAVRVAYDGGSVEPVPVQLGGDDLGGYVLTYVTPRGQMAAEYVGATVDDVLGQAVANLIATLQETDGAPADLIARGLAL